MVAAKPVGAPRLFAFENRAGPDPFRLVLPVVEKKLSPLEVLAALVRRGEMLVHEREDEVDQIREGLNYVGDDVVMMRLSPLVCPDGSDPEESVNGCARLVVSSSERDS
jgi:hypothetical protein